jgi:RNA polymerase sigma factor (TIGR02999 family)
MEAHCMTARSDDVTGLLARMREGDPDAERRLIAVVYPELRMIAGRCLRRERPDHTLQPTALVHEAYIKFVDQRRATWQNRAQFFAVAATVMRRILLDHARARDAEKRGGSRTRVELDDARLAARERDVDLLELDQALGRLAERDPAAARLVELKFFAGLTTEELAETLGTSPSTVEREWAAARGWLYRAMKESAT